MELCVAELLDGSSYKDRVEYGEGSDGAVLGSRDEYQKAWSLSSQNLAQGRWRSLPA